MSEFEKELENVKYSDFDLRGSKRYSCYELIEHFKDWQPPKPLVVVPQIVADYIETQKGNDFDRVGTLVYGHFGTLVYGHHAAGDRSEKHSELHKWITDNFDTFLEAIVNGYTVEKEQLYEVEFYVDEEDDSCLLMKTGKTILFEYESQNEGHYQQQFTESEIKAIDKRYWAFAVKVDEVNP